MKRWLLTGALSVLSTAVEAAEPPVRNDTTDPAMASMAAEAQAADSAGDLAAASGHPPTYGLRTLPTVFVYATRMRWWSPHDSGPVSVVVDLNSAPPAGAKAWVSSTTIRRLGCADARGNR